MPKIIEDIRKEITSPTTAVKVVAIQKALYFSMLGYSPEFAFFPIVEVMADRHFGNKRIAYMAACLIFTDNADVIPLTTGLILRDLQNGSNVFDQELALSFLSNICTPELARDVVSYVVQMLDPHRYPPQLRKKAVMCLYKLFLDYPEALRLVYLQLKDKIDDTSENKDDNPGVRSAVVCVLCELVRRMPATYLGLAVPLYSLLSSIEGNWGLIKVIKMFAYLLPHEPRLVKKLTGPFEKLLSKTKAASVKYECYRTIASTDLATVPSLAGFAVDGMKEFLYSNDQNLRFMGLEAISLLALRCSGNRHGNNVSACLLGLLQPLRKGVLRCLEDEDLTIRRKAALILRETTEEKQLPSSVMELMASGYPFPKLGRTAALPYSEEEERWAVEEDAEEEEEDGGVVLLEGGRRIGGHAGGMTVRRSQQYQQQDRNKWGTSLSQRTQKWLNEVVGCIVDLVRREDYMYLADVEWYLSVVLKLFQQFPLIASATEFRVGHILREEVIQLVLRVPEVRTAVVDAFARGVFIPSPFPQRPLSSCCGSSSSLPFPLAPPPPLFSWCVTCQLYAGQTPSRSAASLMASTPLVEGTQSLVLGRRDLWSRGGERRIKKKKADLVSPFVFASPSTVTSGWKVIAAAAIVCGEYYDVSSLIENAMSGGRRTTTDASASFLSSSLLPLYTGWSHPGLRRYPPSLQCSCLWALAKVVTKVLCFKEGASVVPKHERSNTRKEEHDEDEDGMRRRFAISYLKGNTMNWWTAGGYPTILRYFATSPHSRVAETARLIIGILGAMVKGGVPVRNEERSAFSAARGDEKVEGKINGKGCDHRKTEEQEGWPSPLHQEVDVVRDGEAAVRTDEVDHGRSHRHCGEDVGLDSNWLFTHRSMQPIAFWSTPEVSSEKEGSRVCLLFPLRIAMELPRRVQNASVIRNRTNTTVSEEWNGEEGPTASLGYPSSEGEENEKRENAMEPHGGASRMPMNPHHTVVVDMNQFLCPGVGTMLALPACMEEDEEEEDAWMQALVGEALMGSGKSRSLEEEETPRTKREKQQHHERHVEGWSPVPSSTLPFRVDSFKGFLASLFPHELQTPLTSRSLYRQVEASSTRTKGDAGGASHPTGGALAASPYYLNDQEDDELAGEERGDGKRRHQKGAEDEDSSASPMSGVNAARKRKTKGTRRKGQEAEVEEAEDLLRLSSLRLDPRRPPPSRVHRPNGVKVPRVARGDKEGEWGTTGKGGAEEGMEDEEEDVVTRRLRHVDVRRALTAEDALPGTAPTYEELFKLAEEAKRAQAAEKRRKMKREKKKQAEQEEENDSLKKEKGREKHRKHHVDAEEKRHKKEKANRVASNAVFSTDVEYPSSSFPSVIPVRAASLPFTSHAASTRPTHSCADRDDTTAEENDTGAVLLCHNDWIKVCLHPTLPSSFPVCSEKKMLSDEEEKGDTRVDARKEKDSRVEEQGREETKMRYEHRLGMAEHIAVLPPMEGAFLHPHHTSPMCTLWQPWKCEDNTREDNSMTAKEDDSTRSSDNGTMRHRSLLYHKEHCGTPSLTQEDPGSHSSVPMLELSYHVSVTFLPSPRRRSLCSPSLSPVDEKRKRREEKKKHKEKTKHTATERREKNERSAWKKGEISGPIVERHIQNRILTDVHLAFFMPPPPAAHTLSHTPLPDEKEGRKNKESQVRDEKNREAYSVAFPSSFGISPIFLLPTQEESSFTEGGTSAAEIAALPIEIDEEDVAKRRNGSSCTYCCTCGSVLHVADTIRPQETARVTFRLRLSALPAVLHTTPLLLHLCYRQTEEGEEREREKKRKKRLDDGEGEEGAASLQGPHKEKNEIQKISLPFFMPFHHLRPSLRMALEYRKTCVRWWPASSAATTSPNTDGEEENGVQEEKQEKEDRCTPWRAPPPASTLTIPEKGEVMGGGPLSSYTSFVTWCYRRELSVHACTVVTLYESRRAFHEDALNGIKQRRGEEDPSIPRYTAMRVQKRSKKKYHENEGTTTEVEREEEVEERRVFSTVIRIEETDLLLAIPRLQLELGLHAMEVFSTTMTLCTVLLGRKRISNKTEEEEGKSEEEGSSHATDKLQDKDEEVGVPPNLQEPHEDGEASSSSLAASQKGPLLSSSGSSSFIFEPVTVMVLLRRELERNEDEEESDPLIANTEVNAYADRIASRANAAFSSSSSGMNPTKPMTSKKSQRRHGPLTTCSLTTTCVPLSVNVTCVDGCLGEAVYRSVVDTLLGQHS